MRFPFPDALDPSHVHLTILSQRYLPYVSITCHYPGRAGLLGEHCDWAGGASLAVPVPMGVTVTATASDHGVSCRTVLEGETLEGRWDLGGAVDPSGGKLRFVPAVLSALAARGVSVPATTLHVTSDLPPGRGFSSSAAFTLAVIDALVKSGGQAWPARELAELAYHVEHDLLRVDCGRLDQLACSAKRPLFLRWEDTEPVEVRPVVPRSSFHLVLGAFSKPRDTKAILATLNKHFFDTNSGDDSTAVRSAIGTWGKMAVQGAAALEGGNVRALGAAMNEARAAYETQLEPRLPALHGPLLRQTCAELVQSHAAIGAKFSGAGGDGSIVALFESEADATNATRALNQRGDMSAWYCELR